MSCCLALQVRQALASSNVTRFFRLYACAPRLGRCLMDVAVKQLRWKGLNTLVRAHKPGTLPLPFLATTLGFLLSPEEEEEQQEQRQPPRASPGVFRLTRQLAALTVDESGTLLPGCSERSCTGDNATAVTHEEGLQACLEWCKRHGAVFDSEAGKWMRCCAGVDGAASLSSAWGNAQQGPICCVILAHINCTLAEMTNLHVCGTVKAACSFAMLSGMHSTFVCWLLRSSQQTYTTYCWATHTTVPFCHPGRSCGCCADLSTCCLLTKECWQRLFIPEDTTKVAHGDVNLDIRDFLAL